MAPIQPIKPLQRSASASGLPRIPQDLPALTRDASADASGPPRLRRASTSSAALRSVLRPGGSAQDLQAAAKEEDLPPLESTPARAPSPTPTQTSEQAEQAVGERGREFQGVQAIIDDRNKLLILLTEELTKKEAALHQAEAEHARLERESAHSDADRQRLQKQLEAAQRQVADERSELNSLLARQREKTSHEQQSLQRRKAKAEQFKQKRAQLEERLQHMEEKNAELVADIQGLHSQLDSMGGDLSGMNTMYRQAAAANDRMGMGRARVQGELDKLKANMQTQVDARVEQMEAPYRVQLQHQAKQIESLTADKAALQQQLTQAKAESLRWKGVLEQGASQYLNIKTESAQSMVRTAADEKTKQSMQERNQELMEEKKRLEAQVAKTDAKFMQMAELAPQLAQLAPPLASQLVSQLVSQLALPAGQDEVAALQEELKKLKKAQEENGIVKGLYVDRIKQMRHENHALSAQLESLTAQLKSLTAELAKRPAEQAKAA